MEELIFKYLDNECTPTERKQVERRLQTDEAFASLFYDLKISHDFLLDLPLEQPPKLLSKRVMQQIAPLPFLPGMFLPKMIAFISTVLSIIWAINASPTLQQKTNIDLKTIDNKLIIYTLITLLFFLLLDVILQHQDKRKLLN